MKDSLRESMAQAVDAYVTNSREDWVVEWPGQVVIAASTVHWTTEVSQVREVSVTSWCCNTCTLKNFCRALQCH